MATPPKPRSYADRERAAILSLAIEVATDPTSSADDVRAARARIGADTDLPTSSEDIAAMPADLKWRLAVALRDWQRWRAAQGSK